MKDSDIAATIYQTSPDLKSRKIGGRIKTHKTRNPSQNERVCCEESQYCCENPARFEKPLDILSCTTNNPKGLRVLCSFFPRHIEDYLTRTIEAAHRRLKQQSHSAPSLEDWKKALSAENFSPLALNCQQNCQQTVNILF